MISMIMIMLGGTKLLTWPTSLNEALVIFRHPVHRTCLQNFPSTFWVNYHDAVNCADMVSAGHLRTLMMSHRTGGGAKNLTEASDLDDILHSLIPLRKTWDRRCRLGWRWWRCLLGTLVTGMSPAKWELHFQGEEQLAWEAAEPIGTEREGYDLPCWCKGSSPLLTIVTRELGSLGPTPIVSAVHLIVMLP